MAGWLCCWCWLGLASFLAGARVEQRKFRFVMDEVVLKPCDAGLIQDFKCKLTQLHNRSYLSCNLILRRSIEKLEMDTSLEILKPNNQSMRLYDVHLNVCTFFDTVHKNRLFNVFARDLRKVINGSLECPMISNFNYTLTNWNLKETDLPSYVPECNLKSASKFYANKKLVLRAVVRGRIVNLL